MRRIGTRKLSKFFFFFLISSIPMMSGEAIAAEKVRLSMGGVKYRYMDLHVLPLW
jgi:hypothetical protein